MCDPLWVDITTMPYMAEPEESVTVYEGSVEFDEAIYAMVDECFIFLYWGIFYNMPAKCNLELPVYCVTYGHYIGVFPSYLWWDFHLISISYLKTHLRDDIKTELWAPGHRAPTYFAVQSLFLREQKVHHAIQRRLAASRWHTVSLMLYH